MNDDFLKSIIAIKSPWQDWQRVLLLKMTVEDIVSKIGEKNGTAITRN